MQNNSIYKVASFLKIEKKLNIS